MRHAFFGLNMPTVKVEGQTIHYLTGVNGIAPGRRNIIFVHGAGGNGFAWQNQRRGLDRGVNTICVDLPGHGQSSGPSCTSIAAYSHWLLRFIDNLGLTGVIAAGHSMGGGVILEAAIEYPEMLQALIVVGSGARLKVSSKILQSLETDFNAAAEQLLRNYYGSGSSKKLMKWGLEHLLNEVPEVVLADFRACDGFDRMDNIAQIKKPALVLCGSEDIMTPPKYSQYLAEKLQRATLRIVDKAGHMAMVEKPFEVNASILKFLATL
jgi:pimeloyl-ACP methyl ester carboxylesterase